MSLDTKDLREKNESELQKLLDKTREKLSKVSIEVMQGKTKNTSQAKFLRKDIARIMTVLNENKVEKEQK